ncbi:MAG: PorV/PorQ family protein [Elusimicrobia bacterium]|nr:PorV/PorQ family protein [Elusimicrobiota bacterium]
MRTYAALFLLLFSAPPARAGAGAEALPFLKLDSGARGAALSGAFCAAGDDALSVFYNPAGTALVDKKEILLAHNEWLEGIRNETLAYVQPLGPRLTVFGGVNALLSGKMDEYDALGGRTGSFSALEGAVSAGFSGSLGGGYYGGAAVKSVSQQAAGGKATAWAGDAGLLKAGGGWRFGVSASNFGGRLKFGSRSFGLPLILRAGVSRDFSGNFMLAADGIKAGGAAGAAAVGAEGRLRAGPKEYFLIRAGYRTGRSRNTGPGFTAGLGLTNRDLRVDYAFAPYGDLGDAHRVTVALRFGRPRPAEFKRHPYGDLPKPGPRKAAPAALRETPKKAEGQGEEKKKAKKKGEKGSEVYFMW